MPLGGNRPITTNKMAALDAVESGRAMKNIPITKILENTLNEYDQEHVDRLYYSILENGLIEPITVYLKDRSKETYTILSGHTRLAAIKKLTEEEYKRIFPLGIPASVINKPDTEIDEKIIIHEANLTGRDLSPKERMELIVELKELYEKKGYTDITRKLGDKLSVSYKTIERNVAVSELIPELKEDFANNNLTLKEGAGLASLSSEAQLEVHKLIQTATEKGEKLNSEDVMKIKILEGEKKKLLAEIDATKSELEKRTKEIATLKERIEKNPTSSNRARDLSKIQKKEEEEDALKEKIDELKKQFNISDKEAGARIAAKDWYAMTSARLNKISSTMSVHIDRLDKEEKDRLRKMINKIQNLLDHEI